MLATFIVNSTADAVDSNPGDGQARTSGGLTTLRAAIMEANVTLGNNVIILNAGEFILSLAGSGEDGAASGDLDVNGDLAIVGAGANQTTINAAGIDRIFDVFSNVTFDISGVALLGGDAGADNGGAIYNRGTIGFSNSEISNSSGANGGGIFNDGGTVSIVGSTLWNNTATADGGAVLNSGGNTTIVNSTISGNSAGGEGGGIRTAAGQVTLNHVTIAGNSAANQGGGLANVAGATTNIRNTLVAQNTAPTAGPDVFGTVTSQGHNLITDDSQASGFVFSDRLNYLARIGPLQNNGGPSPTHALLSRSPAIDAGDDQNSPGVDQHGMPRSLDGDGDLLPQVDIGAVEFGFFVDSFNDTTDVNPGDGIVADAAGNRTLRAAVQEANALPGENTITLVAGRYELDISISIFSGAAVGDWTLRMLQAV